MAVYESELPRLEALYKRGIQNGVAGLQLVDREGIRKLEPFCEGIKAIHVPEAGIVDYYQVVQVLLITITSFIIH